MLRAKARRPQRSNLGGGKEEEDSESDDSADSESDSDSASASDSDDSDSVSSSSSSSSASDSDDSAVENLGGGGVVDFSLEGGAEQRWCNPRIRFAIRVIIICAVAKFLVDKGLIDVTKLGTGFKETVRKFGSEAFKQTAKLYYNTYFGWISSKLIGTDFETLWINASATIASTPWPVKAGVAASMAFFLYKTVNVYGEFYKLFETPLCIFLSVSLGVAGRASAAVGSGVAYAARSVMGRTQGDARMPLKKH